MGGVDDVGAGAAIGGDTHPLSGDSPIMVQMGLASTASRGWAATLSVVP